MQGSPVSSARMSESNHLDAASRHYVGVDLRCARGSRRPFAGPKAENPSLEELGDYLLEGFGSFGQSDRLERWSTRQQIAECQRCARSVSGTPIGHRLPAFVPLGAHSGGYLAILAR
jgi:hypothetical protein